MSVSVYSHHITNAPSVTGAVGGLLPMLDAVLVNGISLPSVSSITRSGTTATLVFSNVHGLKYSTRLTVSGCTETDYNGTFIITVVDTTTVTYTVANSPATPATGTPTAMVTSAGWTKPFTGTNLAAYRPASGTQHYLRVNDTFGQNCPIVGYETMTGISTGSNLFPTAAQAASGLYMFKSSATDSVTRPWLVITSDKWVHVWIGRALTTAGDYSSSTTYQPAFFFGDFESLMLGDAFNSVLIGASSSTTAGCTIGYAYQGGTGTATAHYISRPYTGVAGASQCGKYSSFTIGGSYQTTGTDVNRTYPDPVTGGLLLHRMYLTEAGGHPLRGFIPNFYALSANLPGNPGDTFAGRGALAGKTFLLMDVGNSTTRGRAAYDITPVL